MIHKRQCHAFNKEKKADTNKRKRHCRKMSLKLPKYSVMERKDPQGKWMSWHSSPERGGQLIELLTTDGQ